MASQARDGRRTRRIAIAAALPAIVGIGTAHAASFDLFGFDAETQFSAERSSLIRASWK
jgi:hypothetical protein